MSRHVSAENLALYQEEALSPRKLARIRSHLSGCDACSATISGLAAVPGLLARTPAPPMPDRVAERIHAVLASEAAARAEASADAVAGGRRRGAPAAGAAGAAGDAVPGPVPGRPDLPERPRRRSRRPRMPDLTSPLVLRALAATGAVVLIAGVGLLFANSQSPSASNGTAGRPEQPLAGGRSRAAAHVPVNYSAPMSVHYRRNGKDTATTVLTSNVNFTRKSLGTQARKQVSASPTFRSVVPQATASGAASGAANGVNAAQLGACFTRVAAGRKVLVADVAKYLGESAVIIIMRPLRLADVLDVVVVGLACSASDTHEVTTFHVPAG